MDAAKQGPPPYSMWQLNLLSEQLGYNYRPASQRKSKPAILFSDSAANYRLRQLEFPVSPRRKLLLSSRGIRS
jgi:hypothetical protein